VASSPRKPLFLDRKLIRGVLRKAASSGSSHASARDWRREIQGSSVKKTVWSKARIAHPMMPKKKEANSRPQSHISDSPRYES
jgi:hypothetical protein